MVRVGYTLMCEQTGPKQLVDHAVRAEAAGFDQLVMSDHYYPWLDAQGHSPYAWSVLGAVAHATSRAELMSFVTCPIRRYHPAVVAQKASTIGVLSDGRFTLGLGAGENLNEHVVGGWPHVQQRHEMFAEALQIIRPLLNGETLTFSGNHFDVPDAYVWDRPERPGADGRRRVRPSSAALAAEYADGIVATEPDSRTHPDVRRRGRRRAAPLRPGGDLLRPRRGRVPQDRARPVPLVRQRLEGQRRPARPGRLRRRHPVRPRGGRRRGHLLRPGRRRGTSRRSSASSTPASRTWRSCRSAGTASRCSSTGRRSSCCPDSANCDLHGGSDRHAHRPPRPRRRPAAPARAAASRGLASILTVRLSRRARPIASRSGQRRGRRAVRTSRHPAHRQHRAAEPAGRRHHPWCRRTGWHVRSRPYRHRRCAVDPALGDARPVTHRSR